MQSNQRAQGGSEIALHPLCSLFPRMSGAEFEALKDDIKANGLKTPIVLAGGMILDGGNRYRACLEIGVKPDFVDFTGTNLVSHVLSANLHRRHMTAGQQAAIVASAQDWATAHPIGQIRKGAIVAPLSTVADRMAQSGASERTQKTADKVAKESPDLARQVAHGEVSLAKAAEQITPKKAPAAKPEKPKPTAAEREQTQVEKLRTENEQLKARIAELEIQLQEACDASAESVSVAEALQHLKGDTHVQRIAELEREIRELRQSRDEYMNRSAQTLAQVQIQSRIIKKLETRNPAKH